MAYLHIYKNNPMTGTTDGSLVSEGDGSNPIVIGPLNNAESAAQTLAIRCETGYTTGAVTMITPTGTTADKWALSGDGVTWEAYGAALTIAAGITAVNTLFYVKAKATAGEAPQNDTTVDLAVYCANITAV